MARTFRFYGKKRGHRRTGPKTLGVAGEAIFFGVFFLLGCVGLTLFFTRLIVPEWRANHEFVRHTCKVLETRIVEDREGDEPPRYRPEIRIEYQLGDRTHVIWTYDIWAYEAQGSESPRREEAERVAEQFKVGESYVCWYDPQRPGRAILARGYRWWMWPTFLVPISFLLIGGVGLLHSLFVWGKSAERRSAIASRAAGLRVFDSAGRGGTDYRNIPSVENITNSPGTTLAYRLPVAANSSWRLAWILTGGLAWNAAVLVLVAVVIRGFVRGQPDWLLTVFVMPFAAVGIWLIVYFLRQFFLTAGISPTLIEVTDHPLLPRRGYRLFVSQAGRLQMNSFRVALVCEEEATFRQGTDARSEVRVVQEVVLLEQKSFEIERGVPMEVECELRTPDGAMHSFRADHSEIRWNIVVDGDAQGWPPFQRKFPVVVYPPKYEAGLA